MFKNYFSEKNINQDEPVEERVTIIRKKIEITYVNGKVLNLSLPIEECNKLIELIGYNLDDGKKYIEFTDDWGKCTYLIPLGHIEQVRMFRE